MAEQPKRKHGRTQFFIEEEKSFTPPALTSPRQRAMAPAGVRAMAAAMAPTEDTTRAFRFCRLFGKPTDPFTDADDAGLIALGQAFDDPFVPGAGNTTIPAGFTYLGQFVDHDITRDRTEGLPSGSLTTEEIQQGRSPALELDSVYGRGPTGSPELYEADGVRLKIGTTTGRPLFGVTQAFPNDLPRQPESEDLTKSKKAIIGDPRNDENLIVAQIHLSFLKFHNKVVEQLQSSGTAAADLFEAARKTVVQHYQSVVLHDFVRRLADPAIFQDVLANGRKSFVPEGAPTGTYLCMPIEFSVAAYRLGHSLVRGAYQWNRVFSTAGVANFAPALNLFFTFSALAESPNADSLGGLATLPSDWIADWRRLFDLPVAPGNTPHPQLNFARQIDTKLAGALATLPEFANAELPHLKSLAVRNLLRGRLVGLPSGQEAAEHLGVTPLTPAEVASGPHAAIIEAQGFDEKTPLWYYILKEAEIQHGGLQLGAVGSRIIVEVFHGLVEGSEHSILKEDAWAPTLPVAGGGNHFTMNDLLTFVDEINPLGD